MTQNKKNEDALNIHMMPNNDARETDEEREARRREMFMGKVEIFAQTLFMYNFAKHVGKDGEVEYCGFLDGKICSLSYKYTSDKECNLMYVSMIENGSYCCNEVVYYHVRRAVESNEGMFELQKGG